MLLALLDEERMSIGPVFRDALRLEQTAIEAALAALGRDEYSRA